MIVSVIILFNFLLYLKFNVIFGVEENDIDGNLFKNLWPKNIFPTNSQKLKRVKTEQFDENDEHIGKEQMLMDVKNEQNVEEKENETKKRIKIERNLNEDEMPRKWAFEKMIIGPKDEMQKCHLVKKEAKIEIDKFISDGQNLKIEGKFDQKNWLLNAQNNSTDQTDQTKMNDGGKEAEAEEKEYYRENEKRLIIENFEIIKNKYKLKSDYKENRLKIEREIAKELGTTRNEIYKLKKEFGNEKESEETKMKLIRKFEKIKKRIKMQKAYSGKDQRKIEQEIGKELGTSRVKILKWKKEFGINPNAKYELGEDSEEADQQEYHSSANQDDDQDDDQNVDQDDDQNVDQDDDQNGDQNVDQDGDRNVDQDDDQNGDQNVDQDDDQDGDQDGDQNVDQDGDQDGDQNVDQDGDQDGDQNVDQDDDQNGDQDVDQNDDKKTNDVSQQRLSSKLKIFDDKTKMAKINVFDKNIKEIKRKNLQYYLKNRNEIEKEIAKQLGICRSYIWIWKRELGLTKTAAKFSKREKLKIIANFDKIKTKILSKIKSKVNGELNKYIEEEIAKKFEVKAKTIYQWKFHFGLLRKRIYTKKEKEKMVKKFKRMKRANPLISDQKIGETLNINSVTVKRWEKQIKKSKETK